MSAEQLIGIEHPIVQAPMAGVQDSRLAIQVSEAGALGSLPCAMLNAEQLQVELTKISSATKRPFNVNFFCHKEPVADNERERRWRLQLEPFFNEYEINPQDIPAGGGRQPFSHEVADVVEPFKPVVVSFHFGLPESGLLARVKSWGSTVVSSATTVREARWLEAHGADVIIAQGLEAGGHRGMFLTDDVTTQVGTFALLPQVLDAVNVPVIAAGGIADRAGIRAALSLGASAVQMGTAFLLCDETNTSQLHRDALKSEDAVHSALTNVFSGRPARSLVNRAVRQLGPMNPDVQSFPLAAIPIAALRNRAEALDSADFSPLWCGQNPAGCKEVPVAELIKGLIP